ncbi:hypothetical protein JR346_09195 [Rothia sp. ZJ932]|nr:hypothetical protein JR346_09195 [Rothia sp. ZJ932]
MADWAGILAVLVAGSWGYGILLTNIGSNQPYIDSFTTVIAVIAPVAHGLPLP